MVEINYFSFLSCLTGQHCLLHMSHPKWALCFSSLFVSVWIPALLWSHLQCWVCHKRALGMLGSVWGLARTPLAMAIEPFWGGMMSCMTLTEQDGSCTHTEFSWNRGSSISPPLFSQALALWSHRYCAQGTVCKTRAESPIRSYHGWMTNQTYRKNSTLSQKPQVW